MFRLDINEKSSGKYNFVDFFLKKVQAIKNMQTISETAMCIKGLFGPPYEAKI